MTAIPINTQIALQEDQVAFVREEMPKAVARGTVSQSYADHKIATIEAILNTLKLIRAAGRGEVLDV